MRNLTAKAAAGALAAPLLLIAVAGVAAADSSSYTKETTMAGADGATTESVRSHADSGHHGRGGDGSHYRWTKTGANAEGAWSKQVSSHADTGHGDRGGDRGFGFGYLGGVFG